MCGIAGYIGLGTTPAISSKQLEEMVNTLYHRGPDESGMDIVENVAMGMRRLAIIDLSGGTQPIWNEDHTIWTVYNGEIYNFPELRADLESRGHVFRTHTDTEIIVHGYEEWGIDFPKKLDGMFAIALHDTRKRKCVLIRDHMGIKPLFYSITDKQVVFGSEIKAVLASGAIEKSLDVTALNEFLTWEYVPGSHTLFKSIRKLEPASLLEIDLEIPNPHTKPKVYWTIPHKQDTDQSLVESDWIERVESVIADSVKRQLVSDVPLGAFLSGGVDSSLIVSQMGAVKTFSIGFDDPSYNELKWARQVAEHLGVDHKDEVIKPNVVELYNHLMEFMDDPIGDFSIFPTYLVSKLARQHVTVSLSGDGGDELFGGYETYLAQLKAGQYQRIPSFFRRHMLDPMIRSLRPTSKKKGLINKAKRFVEGLGHPEALAHTRWRVFLDEAHRNELFEQDILDQQTETPGQHIERLFKECEDRSLIDQMLYVDVKSYMVDNCLTKVDRMSMANSLESRVPFLSPKVVETAFRLPEVHKIRNNQTKVLLKKVAARHIPSSCIYRPKEGFSIPIKNWLGNEFRELMEELLSSHRIRSEGIFNAETIQKLKNQHLNGVANHSHILWGLMVFQTWKQKWLD